LKKNPFKEIQTHKEVPAEIRKNVMEEVASISLASELAELFTVKFASVLEGLFAKNKKRK
jgi:hypothetical protein